MTQTNYNSSYAVFTPNDCANFINQALKAGGVPYKYGSTNLTKWYYGASGNWSLSWVNAHAQFRFFANNYYTSQESILGYQITGSASTVRNSSAYASLISGLYEGDLIYFDHENNGSYDHVMMVTKLASGRVYISGHTYNQLNNELANVIWGNKYSVNSSGNVVTTNPYVKILAISFQGRQEDNAPNLRTITGAQTSYAPILFL